MKVINETNLSLTRVFITPYTGTIEIRLADVTFWIMKDGEVRSGAETEKLSEENRFSVGDDFFRVYVTEEMDIYIYQGSW